MIDNGIAMLTLPNGGHMRHHRTFLIGFSLLLAAGCATVTPEPRTATTDELQLVVNNESSVDVTVFLLHETSARALGRVDASDSRTFRVSRRSVWGQRIELRAFDESLHITPNQVMGLATRESREIRPVAKYASGPFPSEHARQVTWRIGNTLVTQLTWR
jgi:hypothetical protein